MNNYTRLTQIATLFILLALILSLTCLADTIKVGSEKITYDDIIDYGKMKSHYFEDSLVLSTFDNDMNGEIDQWFVYSDGFVLRSALQDSDGNGNADYFVDYDEKGNVVTQKVKEPLWKRFLEFAINNKEYLLGGTLLALAFFGWFMIYKRIKKRSKQHNDNHVTVHKKKHKDHREFKENDSTPKKTNKLVFVLVLIVMILLLIIFQQYVEKIKTEKSGSIGISQIILPEYNDSVRKGNVPVINTPYQIPNSYP